MKEFQEYWEEIRELNFDEREGSPYWIEKIKEFNVNPEDLNTIEDFLQHPISICDEDDIKRNPIEYFIPKKILKERNFIPLISSGSMGKKKTVPWSEEAIEENGKHLAKILKLYGVKENSNYLFVGPSYPAPFEPIASSLVKKMKGTIYFAPIETKGVKKDLSEKQDLVYEMARADNMEKLKEILSRDISLKERFEPCLEYVDDILGKERIDFLGTAPFWLNSLENHRGFENVKFVYVGGMEMPPEIHKFWKERLKSEGRELITSYGHFRFGLAFDLPNQSLTYYFHAPLTLLFVTKEENPYELVNYGERGRVRYLSLDKAMLWCQVERDYAERVTPNQYFSWDGVKQIKAKF